MLLKGADMNDWQVTLYANAPVWHFGKLIAFTSAPGGEQVPFLLCSTVEPLPTGFVELTVAVEGTDHALKFLVPTQHVLGVMYVKQRHQPGFAMPPAATETNTERPMPTSWRTSARPSTPVVGDTTDTA